MIEPKVVKFCSEVAINVVAPKTVLKRSKKAPCLYPECMFPECHYPECMRVRIKALLLRHKTIAAATNAARLRQPLRPATAAAAIEKAQ